MAVRIAATLLISTAAYVAAVRSCWFPDGVTPSPGDVPCDPDAAHSACCLPEHFCYTNGLCLGNDGWLGRGSCTDQDWNDRACATQCRDVNPSGGTVIRGCDWLSSAWTCYGSCNYSTFVLGPDSMGEIVLRERDGGGSATIVNSNSVISGLAGRGNGSSVTTTVTSTATSSAATGTNAHFTTGQMAGVGAGVAGPLLLALAAAIVVILRQRRRLHAVDTELKSRGPTCHSHIDDAREPRSYNDTPSWAAEPKAKEGFGKPQPMVEMDGWRPRQELDAAR